jgi:hypothetical protein
MLKPAGQQPRVVSMDDVTRLTRETERIPQGPRHQWRCDHGAASSKQREDQEQEYDEVEEKEKEDTSHRLSIASLGTKVPPCP